MNYLYQGDCVKVLQKIPSKTVRLAYIDPPFNTGKIQKRKRIKVTKVADKSQATRVGFGGKMYKEEEQVSAQYTDTFADYSLFIKPVVQEIHRILTDDGSLFFHVNYREVHYCKVWIDEIFGRNNFINEIIWSYDYGARSKTRWSAKHDNILWFAKNRKNYCFNYNDIDRIPYLAPGLVGPEKAARGKTPTDCWWHTIVPTNGKEKTGYPTQKPLGIMNRIIKVHSNPGDMVLDCFAGSGTTGEAASVFKRNWILVDNNPDAIEVIKNRLKNYGFEYDEM